MSVLEVKNPTDYKRFESIWFPSWIEQGYCLECYIMKGVKNFIFYGPQGDYGSLQIAPYNTDSNCPINKNFPFNEFSELHNKKVIEVEKLAIKKEKKGSLKSFVEIFSFLTTYCFKENIDCMIALLNPDVYNIMVWRLNIPIKKLIKIGYNDPTLYPIIIDADSVKKSKFGKRISKQQNRILV